MKHRNYNRKYEVKLLDPLPRRVRARLTINRVIDAVGIELARGRFWPLAGKWWTAMHHLHVYYYPIGRHNEKWIEWKEKEGAIEQPQEDQEGES
jgi:hypothetical protein